MATDNPLHTTVGQHWLADLRGIEAERLRDERHLMQVLVDALVEAGFNIIKQASHKFPAPGEGVTGFVLLSESHASFHTYPEHEYMAFDLFSCGSSDPELVIQRLIAALEPTENNIIRRPRTA